MSYDYILQKAQQEPDLQDVVQYLKKTLHLLQDLEHSYNKLVPNEQSSIENHNIKLKIDNIVGKYLPGLIDEYCKFSFSHRNTAVIKTIYGKNYTAKELLLKNIGKITEESILLHDEFYENNKFQFLVHDKIASSLGFEKNSVGKTQPAIALQNTFNYDTYTQNNSDIFKKEDLKKEHNVCAADACTIDTPIENKRKFSDNQYVFFIRIILLMLLSIIICLYFYSIVAEQRLKIFKHQVSSIQSAMDLYFVQNDLNATVDNQTLIDNTFITKDELFYHPWSSNLKVRAVDEKYYAIDLFDIPENVCNTLSNNTFTSSTNVIVNNSTAPCGANNHLQLIKIKKIYTEKETDETLLKVNNLTKDEVSITYNNIPKKECELLQNSLSVNKNYCKDANSVKITYTMKD